MSAATTPGFETTVLDFVDGPQFMIYDPDMHEYTVLLHRQTMSLLHGSRLQWTTDPATGFYNFTFGERVLGTCPDRATFMMVMAANAEVGEVDPTEEASAQFQLMLSARKDSPALHEDTGRAEASGRKLLTLKVRVAPGVAVHQLPVGPWTATAEQVTDREGQVVYTRVGNVPPARSEPTAETAGFLNSLRNLFRGNR